MHIRSLVALLVTLVIFAATPSGALAQPATPVDLDATVDGHLAWVLHLFDGGVDDLAAADVEARFDANFLRLVPPEELIPTVRAMADELGPLALVERRPAEAGEYVGVYQSSSGEGVLIAFAVDPGTGLISGFFITRIGLPAGGATPAASPAA